MEKTLLSEVLHMGVGWVFGSANNCKIAKSVLDSIDQRSCENGTPTGKHRSMCIKKNKNSVKLIIFPVSGHFSCLSVPCYESASV